MIASLSSEWLKIRTTRTIFWLLLTLASVITLIAVAAILSTEPADLSGSRNQTDIIGIGVLAIVIALMVGLIVSTGEFRHGTITPTLLATPSRSTLVISKAIAAMVLGGCFVIMAVGLAIAELTALLPIRGVDLALELDDVGRTLAHIVPAAMIWAAIGSGLGLAFRNQIGTFVGCFGGLFFVDPIVQSVLASNLIDSKAGRFTPLSATGAILSDGGDENLFGPWTGAIVMSGWLLLVTIAALVLLSRRDIS